MGCGKSSVGRELSQLLCCRFMDLDEVVEEVAGKSISEIFTEDGEGVFRNIELESLKNILCDSGRGKEIPMTPVCASRIHPLAGGGMSSTSHLPTASAIHTIDNPDIPAVLALGGGTVMTEECAELIKANTCCIYLRASVDTIVERLSRDGDSRPLLNTSFTHSRSNVDVYKQGADRHGNPLQDRIAELLEQRAATYEKTANIVIDTDGKSIDDISFEIFELLR